MFDPAFSLAVYFSIHGGIIFKLITLWCPNFPKNQDQKRNISKVSLEFLKKIANILNFRCNQNDRCIKNAFKVLN